MRKVLLGCLLLVLIAIPLSGQTDEWKTYRSTEGNFFVLFPDEPQDSVNASDANMQSHTLAARQGSIVYTVVFTHNNARQTVDEPTFQVFQKAVFAQMPKCSVETEQPAAPAITSYIGHWYRATCDVTNVKVAMQGNLYWGQHYAYAVMALFPADSAEPAMADRFLHSFALIDAER